MTKSVLIVVFLLAGLFFPAVEAAAFLIRPFLMLLLFFSFLNVRIDRTVFHRAQFVTALVLPLLALGVYQLAGRYDPRLAVTLFLITLAPVAVITPVIIGIMRRDVGYAVGAILVSHAALALVLPLLLPPALNIQLSTAALLDLFVAIGTTVLLPLVAAQVCRRIQGRLLAGLRAIGPYSFGLFLFNIFVASAKLADFIQHNATVTTEYLLVTAASSIVLCALLFGLGSRLTPPGLRVESSLGFGRKNTMLVIWIALTYVDPLATLAPMLYILWQNLLVAGMIAKLDARQRAKSTNTPAV